MTSNIEKTFSVEGMTCGHCEMSVREEVEAVAGVEEARADHATGTLVVSGDQIDDDAIRAAVAEAGYRVTS